MNKLEELAELIFPEITETIDDLEKRYPERNLPAGAMVTRFAPSPTGFLHTGSLFSSLIAYRFAKQSNGVFIFRLEDTDTKREIEGSDESLIKELSEFNIIPDECIKTSMKDEYGAYAPYRQSDRATIYKIVIKELIKRGDAYPCFCSSEDLDELRKYQEANKLSIGYCGDMAKCSHLTAEEAIELIKAGKPYVIRFRSKGNSLNKVKVHDEVRGDLELQENDQHIVIFKSDGLPTYHFAHLVDDHFMRTTHVTRGEEWLPSLPIHKELFERMNWTAPKYAHIPVIMKLDNGNKRKLSKRKDVEAAVSYFLKEGYPAKGFIEYLITIANSNFEEWRLQNMNAPLEEFNLSFDKMTLDGALFDLDKVKNICKERLARMTKDEFTSNASKYAKLYEPRLQELIDRDVDYFKSIINIEREKDNPRKDYEKFSDVYPLISFFYNDLYDELLNNTVLPFKETMSIDTIKDILTSYSANMGLELTEQEWFENLKGICTKCGFAVDRKEYKKNPEAYKGNLNDFMEVIRIAVSTRQNIPNPYFVLNILGKDVINERFNKVLNKLSK